jgi:hypothetical protein
VPRSRHEYFAYVYKTDIVDAVDREGPFSGHLQAFGESAADGEPWESEHWALPFETHDVSAEEAIAWGRERATRVTVAFDTPAERLWFSAGQHHLTWEGEQLPEW